MIHTFLYLFFLVTPSFQRLEISNLQSSSGWMFSYSSKHTCSLFSLEIQSCDSPLHLQYRVESRKSFSSTTLDEKNNSYECRQEIRKLAHKLRIALERLVSQSIPGFWQKIRTLRHFYPYIDALEREALNCCQNGQDLNTSIAPLVEHLYYWEFEGLPKDLK